MSKGGKQQTVTAPDATAQQRQAAVWQAAQNVGSPMGPPPIEATQANGLYGNALNQGNLGLNALGGNGAAVQGLMNPYLNDVVGATQADWQHTNAQTAAQLGSMATQAGAFGGSRYGVALGDALANNNLQEQNQLANLRYGGFNDVMQRAGQLAGFGFGGAQGTTGLINYLDPRYRQLAAMQSGIASAPGGQTQTTTGKNGSDPLAGAIGGATVGAHFGPWGAAIGGGLGLLGSFI